jgi:hypothetical protein
MLFWENLRMSRRLQAFALTLTVAALSVFATSCGSRYSAQMRVLNAIPDGQAVDVKVNGTKDFSKLQFTDFAPTPQPGYATVPSGGITVEAVLTGTSTSAPPHSSFNLNGSTQYTVILEGFNSEIVGVDAPIAVPYTDNNTAPASGKLEFRVINASPSSPGGLVDVYFEPNPFNGDLTSLTPQVSGLAYTQASPYQTLAANAQGSGFQVIVTASGNKTALIQQSYASGTTGGTITTLVLVDVLNGGKMSQVPLLLNDLN